MLHRVSRSILLQPLAQSAPETLIARSNPLRPARAYFDSLIIHAKLNSNSFHHTRASHALALATLAKRARAPAVQDWRCATGALACGNVLQWLSSSVIRCCELRASDGICHTTLDAPSSSATIRVSSNNERVLHACGTTLLMSRCTHQCVHGTVCERSLQRDDAATMRCDAM